MPDDEPLELRKECCFGHGFQGPAGLADGLEIGRSLPAAAGSRPTGYAPEAPGAVFWHPKGWTLFQALIGYMRRRKQAWGYVEVNSPDMLDRALWE